MINPVIYQKFRKIDIKNFMILQGGEKNRKKIGKRLRLVFNDKKIILQEI